MRLDRSEVEPYLSPYLMGGWRQDELVLKSVVVGTSEIAADLDAVAYFVPGDGNFHLSVPVAVLWIAQIAIIYGCIDNHIPKKTGEIYLREIALECRRPITESHSIGLTLKLLSKRLMPKSVYYHGTIDIAQGAFLGTGKFVFPLAASAE